MRDLCSVKTNPNNLLALFAALCGACVTLHGQSPGRDPFSFSGAYVGDLYANTAGGLGTGAGYMGMGNIKIGFDTGKAGWWKGGGFFVNGASIHGKSLSETFSGDLQIASNIDAGEHVYLHELWVRQRAGSVTLTMGLQDLNADFMVSEGAGRFINSSFGVPPVIATGIPVPIFPLTGPGLSVVWEIDERWTLQGALFDGKQTSFEHNPHNLHWSFCHDDGMLTMSEIHFRGRYKLGAYYHSADKNYGFYALADQPLGERVSLFGQLALAPKGKNENNYYFGAGANLSGVFDSGGRDEMGVALAHAGLHDTGHRHETALEFYYKYTVSENIALQPDIQYIINPSGTGDKLKNALAGILRLRIDF
jgi:porin